MKPTSIAIRQGSIIAHFDAVTTSQEIHATKAMAALAEKIRDPEAYEKAALLQLERECEFAGHVEAKFPPKPPAPGPGRGKKAVARSVNRFKPVEE